LDSIWRRLKAVVFESDDWGLCAWSPDDQAHRVLAESPAFRSPAGRIYGRSTLESAEDVRRLVATLLEFRGADGFPPVWQANTVVAAPDYARLEPPLFPAATLPVLTLPVSPSRWRRPGLWEEVRGACASGVWWPELHGFHHLPERAWLAALRQGQADARHAFEQQSPVCGAVESSGEFDPSEPGETKRENLRRALETFSGLFGRPASSFCPPDYRWDDVFEGEAETLGVTLWQGRSERAGRSFPTVRRVLGRRSWRSSRGARFYMPPRIAFEPRGDAGAPGARGRLGVADAHRRVRAARDQILQLVRVAVEVVQLVERPAVAIHPVNELVAVGANGLVAHADEPRERVLAEVLAQDRFPPAGALADDERQQRPPLH